uniref:Uncharacterized protein n=1 Tax=Romanomermis culicivorax TaxID=13658 RepID=A0A915I8U0_ROMCU
MAAARCNYEGHLLEQEAVRGLVPALPSSSPKSQLSIFLDSMCHRPPPEVLTLDTGQTNQDAYGPDANIPV